MGFFELLLVALLVVFFFGARKLPAIGAGLGKTVRSVKDAFQPDAPTPRADAARDAREALPPARETPPEGDGRS